VVSITSRKTAIARDAAKLKLFEQGKLKKNGSMAKLSVGRRRRFAQEDNERASYLSA